MHSRYVIYWNAEKALEIVPTPGVLVSKFAPPPTPGAPPATNPFLSAIAFMPEREQELREILDRSQSLDDYLAHLKNAGYTVSALTSQEGVQRESDGGDV